MSFLKKIFSKKTKKEGLELALKMGLITEQERWSLERDRADRKFKDLTEKRKKHT
jgi:hypothetical protein